VKTYMLAAIAALTLATSARAGEHVYGGDDLPVIRNAAARNAIAFDRTYKGKPFKATLRVAYDVSRLTSPWGTSYSASFIYSDQVPRAEVECRIAEADLDKAASFVPGLRVTVAGTINEVDGRTWTMSLKDCTFE
jgi:hypothetical protein